MSSLTISEVLAMPLLRRSHPVVLAGEDRLDEPVRWVHATELADIAPLLREGDLVLSTGIALPEAPVELAEFAASLRDVGAVGLMLELGRRWTVAPPALVDACRTLSLPLVSLGHEVRFAAITQAVGERIVDDQLTELRDAERIHETFTELSLAEAGPSQILAEVQRLSGAAVVLESEHHRVLDYVAGQGDVADFVADWQGRSRAVRSAERTSWDERNGWLLTRLGTASRGWGRLVLQSTSRPPQRLVVLVERAAAALAMHRLQDRDRDNLVRRTQAELLRALGAGDPSTDLLRRCELAGFPTARRRFAALVVRPRERAGRETPPGERSVPEGLLSAVVHATHELGVPALVGELDGDVRVLLSLGSRDGADDLVETLVRQALRQTPVVAGAGRVAPDAASVDRTLREAQQVVDAVPEATDHAARLVHRLEDVHLRGLLSLLGEDDRVRLFVARELDGLRSHDEKHGTTLLLVLRAFVEHPQSKSAAAAALHLSRPAFYARLAQIEQVLDVRLDDPDIRVSLHVALIAEEIVGASG
ncbi:MAG: PucR family transcriptional regulator ligand-binding domain-containing protein [Nocardioidaceae bacterium]